MPKFSVMLPVVCRRPRQAARFAALVERTHAARLWQGQTMHAEPHQIFAYLAGAGMRVSAGLGVTLMAMRHPLEAAAQARSVALATGQPVVAGYGPGGTGFQVATMGRPYQRPLAAVREYVTIVRQLLSGGAPDVDGEYFSCHAPLPPCGAPPVEVGLGVLRPGMARLAGEVADAAITWLTPAPYLRDVVRPALLAGAAAAGRRPPRLVAMVPLAMATPDQDVTDIVLASNQTHMSVEHYRDMLRRAGIDLPENDPGGMAKAAVAGGAFLAGGPEELRAGIEAYLDAGVDEIVFNLTGVRSVRGVAAAEQELAQLLEITEPLTTIATTT